MNQNLFQFIELLVFLQSPLLALQESGGAALEHLRSLLVALQLPLQPGQSRNSEFSTMRLTIGTAMTYGEVHSKSRYVVDAMEIVHTITIGDIGLTTEQVHNRSPPSRYIIGV